jgi:hypothetical protein
MSRYQDDPEYRERIKKQARERYHNIPGVSERQNAQTMERYYTDPAFRARVCAQSRKTNKQRMDTDPEFRLQELQRLKTLRGLPQNPETVKRGRKRHRTKAKKLVYDALGYACVCCGEENQAFLTIDHINGTGKEHRRIIGRTPQALYEAIRKEGFPKEKYRVLCMNCNWATRFGQICPHQEARQALKAV